MDEGRKTVGRCHSNQMHMDMNKMSELLSGNNHLALGIRGRKSIVSTSQSRGPRPRPADNGRHWKRGRQLQQLQTEC